MKVSRNFVLQEFIDPKTYKKFGAKSIWFIDQKIIGIAQLLRDLTGKPVTINNWNTGGSYKLSGFRPPSTTIGAKLSQHRFGRGIDPKVEGMTTSEVHKLIIHHKDAFIRAGLTTMESIKLTPTWTHLDCRHTGEKDILIVGL